MDETPKAAAAYAEYEAMGVSRSLAKLAEQHQQYAKSIPLLKRWSSEHHWQERVKAFDLAQIEAKRLERERQIELMNERHAQIGVTLQAKALKQIEALIQAGKFGSQATVMALKLALDSERLARGDVTERVEQQQNGSIAVTLTPAAAQQIVEETPDELSAWRKNRGLPPPTEEHLG